MNPNSADVSSEGAAGGQFVKREQSIEVAVFLFLIVPSLVLSFFVIHQGNISFMLMAPSIILRDLSLLSLILFFLWRNNESILCIGLTRRHIRRDILLGIVLFVPMFFGAGILERTLAEIGFSVPSAPLPSLEPSRSAVETLVALVLVTVVALTEETIFRGYLMLRFKAFIGSLWWNIVLSAFIFSLGHGYEGTAGVVTVGAMGLIFSLVYTWRKSLVAPITMHFLQDFLGIVLVPLLVGK